MSEKLFENYLKCRCTDNHSFGALPKSSRFFIQEAKPHYAPDRLVDVEQIKLEIEVDLEKKKLWGLCTNVLRGVSDVVSKVTFDAIDLIVEKVTDGDGNSLKFDRSPTQLTIFLKKAISRGDRVQIVIQYHVTEPRAGLYFISPDKDYPDRPMQLWTQGQDEDNRYWIPCHDSPNEKAATEMVVTVNEKYSAISNGRLVDTKISDGKKTFHWKQSIPHASYLITLCVGQFHELKDSWKDSNGNEIPVNYWTLPGRESETKLSFGKTPKMMSFFSKKIGFDYPYEKYDQVVAWDFVYGGMENTSSTTQTEYTLHPESVEQDYSSEPLVAHELAHQWFGDLLTCKEWSHAWLNEGFATYCESLWTEEEYGNDEFLYDLYINELVYKGEDRGSYRRPIVTNIFMAPSDIFDRHLYEKGGRVLHMLRKLVGDDAWWKSINRYVTDHYAKTVETVDLQRAFEETTGRSLSWFFDQWIFKAGYPELSVRYEWVEDKKVSKFIISQKQKTDDLTGIFRLPLTIKVATSDGEYIHEVELDSIERSFSFPCPEKPKYISVNPGNTILCSIDFKPGSDLLIEQLKIDKDIMGRIFAAKSLSKEHSRKVVDALGEQLIKESFWGVQSVICDSLGEIGTPMAQDYLIKNLDRLKHPKARKNAIKALGLFKNNESFETLMNLLKGDPSPLCQYEAGVALGKLKLQGTFDKLNGALGKRDTWHDYYNRGILMGLAELKHDERVLTVLQKHTKPGFSMFLRRDAVAALAHHSQARPGLIIDSLMELTRDSNYFVKVSAIHALADLGDTRAGTALQRIADSAVEPRTKRSAILALKSIREGNGPNDSISKLKDELDRMREQLKELNAKFEKIESK